MIAYLVFLQE